MKERTVSQLGRWIMLIVPYSLFIAPLIESSSTLDPLDHREAYFNGSSYIRMHTPLSLETQIGLSFRTCVGGELFSQRHKENSIELSVNRDGLVFGTSTTGKKYETKIIADLLNNRWHTVSLRYVLENFTLSVGSMTEVIANRTHMPELLTNPVFFNEGAILIVGTHFNGCILEGPTISFRHSSMITPFGNIQFGPCPLPLNSCVMNQDIVMPGHQDHCIHNPCMMQGTCISRPDKYECHCTARYHGKNCEVDLGSPCLKQLCKNGATCTEDLRGDYTCTCLPLFTGQHCEQRISSASICDTNPCLNNGLCKVNNGKKECTCPPGFIGQHCEENVKECASNPCYNGVCKDGINSFTCDCTDTGYRGSLCEENINECLLNPCKNDGICFDNYGSYTCQCQRGFDGTNCELNLNECLTQPCSNRGTCIDKLGGYDCSCEAGFSGKNCDIKLSSCISSSCPPYADCVEHGHGYKCICKPGFNNGQYVNCTTETTICHTNPCKNGGSCSYHVGTYNCTCLPGFTGPNCEHNLPSMCSLHPCKNGATCVNDQFTSRCVCPEMFTGDHCEHSVKCSEARCVHSTSCSDFEGGYYCNCEPGWTGMNCNVDIDECLSEPCRNGATCINERNTHNQLFTCQCAPGFTGTLCQTNIDECLSNQCLNGGTCVDQVNGYHCNCTNDFMGTNCEKPYNVCEFKPCENNGTCIMSINKHDYTCECLRGFEGKKCDKNIDDCVNVVCPPGKICVDRVDDHSCECPTGYTGDNCSIEVDPCQKGPCKNGATCILNPATHDFACKCTKEWKGQHCDTDIDECVVLGPNLCGGNGICVNNPGGYQCYCKPGYTGESCDLDFDECLSMPCKNNATCKNEVNNYRCTCTPGYTGKDCGININECDSNPCMAGATCIDGIANFTCQCQLGFTGLLCNINIDDCAGVPCLNGGLCLDGINNYTCNCADTGYTGAHCEINIDDCLSNPCKNGANCLDGIKDYTCNCYDGYIGKNCEEDVNECVANPCKNNGTCYQRSDEKLYYPYTSEANTTLPATFRKPFDYEEAAGFECVCVPGSKGTKCEVDINECENNQCMNGAQCLDRLGYYLCDCEDGFEGEHCQIDIDECEKFHPCEHGVCKDKRANYFCECDPSYGGKNCSVELTGCNDYPCQNNGSCKPYLENETDHKFNCTCHNGYHGHSCELITTMSMTGKSYVNVNTTREEGYDISFRFRTTLEDGLLAMGRGVTFYILELMHGKLNLHSSLVNKWDGVFIGSNLSNSEWQKVFVAINSTHLVLSANEEQTIYPINNNEGPPSQTSFPITFFGGTESNLKNLAHGPSFIGCAEDVVINGEWVLPQNTSWVSLVDVEVGCPRESQCAPNPCHSGGRCTDKWRTFSCTCERPYLGHTCQYNYTAATFGYENISTSLVSVAVDDQAKRAIRTIVDISMFIRTRQLFGQIFYLGSTVGGGSLSSAAAASALSLNTDETYIAAQLEKGELLVRIQFNGTPEAYTVGGVKLNNGYNHLIEVIRNVTLVQVKINGTEYFRKTISSTGQLDAQVLFLGGQPQVRTIRQAASDNNIVVRPDTTPASGSVSVTTPLSMIHFKGIIQDVQISNGSHKMVVEFYPLEKVRELGTLVPFGNVSFDHDTVLEGVLSDDSCRINPCANGTCINTWNDYKCECARGFKGKNCDELEFCQVQDCPDGSYCRNLDDGYECVANATLNGDMPPAFYNFVTPPSTSKDSIHFNTMEISYRTKTGGTVLFAKSSGNYFIVFVSYDQVIVEWKIDGFADRKSIRKDHSQGDWVTLYFLIKDSMLVGGTKDSVEDGIPNFTSQMNVLNFTNLFVKGTIYVGGSDNKTFDVQRALENYTTLGYNASLPSAFGADDADGLGNTVDLPDHASVTTDLPPLRRLNDLDEFDKGRVTDRFKGCIGELRIGNYLLPFFKTDDIYNGTANHSPKYFDLQVKSNFVIGCILCYQHDCKFGGACENPELTYSCKCLPGFAREDCSENIDECRDSTCANNATCVDGIANYTCSCVPGYKGWLCDEEIDECSPNPCQNGGICEDLLNDYKCECQSDYVGRRCEAKRQITCENRPCFGGSTCVDGFNEKTENNFTCVCADGMSGPLCDTAFCMLRACGYGRCNTNVSVPFCQCDDGFDGKFCDNNIDDCEGDPCLNGGNCTDGIAKFLCDCSATGFMGEKCEIDIDECDLDATRCGRGQCKNELGSFRCICDEGMCGHGCVVPDPCIENPVCGPHGTCEPYCTTEPDYKCLCKDNFVGTYCNETEVSAPDQSGSVNPLIIIIPIVLLILIGGGIGLTVFIAMARSKRATRGTYSPSAQEFCNPRVELDHVLKPPPEERLI